MSQPGTNCKESQLNRACAHRPLSRLQLSHFAAVLRCKKSETKDSCTEDTVNLTATINNTFSNNLPRNYYYSYICVTSMSKRTLEENCHSFYSEHFLLKLKLELFHSPLLASNTLLTGTQYSNEMCDNLVP